MPGVDLASLIQPSLYALIFGIAFSENLKRKRAENEKITFLTLSKMSKSLDVG